MIEGRICDVPDSLAKYLMEWHLAYSAYAIQPREEAVAQRPPRLVSVVGPDWPVANLLGETVRGSLHSEITTPCY